MISRFTDTFSVGTLPAGFARLFFIGLLAAVPLCGCHKKNAAPAAPPEPAAAPATAPNPAGPDVPAHGPPVAQALPPTSQSIAANATAEAVAEKLTAELRRYVAYTRTIPKSFEDFAARDPIKFPPAPAGKKYVIANGAVVLQ